MKCTPRAGSPAVCLDGRIKGGFRHGSIVLGHGPTCGNYLLVPYLGTWYKETCRSFHSVPSNSSKPRPVWDAWFFESRLPIYGIDEIPLYSDLLCCALSMRDGARRR